MKTGKTLQELAAEIQRQSEAKRDALVPTQTLHVNSNTDQANSALEFGQDEAFSMLPLAHHNLADMVGMPQRWYDTLREHQKDWRIEQDDGTDFCSLFDLNLNIMLGNRPQDERRLVRTLDGRARALLSDRYRPIDHEPILLSVLPVLQEESGIDWDSASLEITDTRLYLKVVNRRITQDVALNDPVQAGVVITNSEVGLGAFRVQPLLYRLRCLNGMIQADESVAKYHVGGALGDAQDGQAYSWLADDTINARNVATVKEMRDVVRSALNDVVFERAVNRAREANGIKIEGDPVAAVQWVSNRFRLTEAENTGILRNLVEGGGLNLWSMVNAITQHAQADSVDYDRSTELEAVGGRLLSLPAPEIKTMTHLEAREPVAVMRRERSPRTSRRRER